MSAEEFFAHGSRWLRADFHLHTRRDKEFQYDGADDEYVKRYIAALKATGIRVGVITNHNKFDREEFRTLKKAAAKDNIYLLPGVELSVNDGANGVHTLVVFKEHWIENEDGKDYINAFLDVTYAGHANRENDNARSNHSFLDTIRELNKFEREYFLICAHVEAKNGLWSEIGGGRLGELGQNDSFRSRVAAFQKVRSHDKEKVCRTKVKEWFQDWYPAEVEGSDPKNIEEIGKGQKSFIKIGAFTFEALQFALKPNTGRLAQDEAPQFSHSWVRSIRFDGGIFDGKQLNFSQQLNCLIGIRGSGKSAILETLRYAVGPALDDTIADYKYKQSLVDYALGSGGKVVVETVDEHGRPCEVSRILNESADVYCDKELKTGVSTRTVLSNARFFGQKELIPRSDEFGPELLEKLVASHLETVRREIAQQKQKVSDVLGDMDKLQDLDALEKEYQTKQRDAEFKLELFRTHGVEEQLRRQVEFNADVTNARRAVATAAKSVQAWENFLNEQETELATHEKITSQANAELIGEFNAIYTALREVPQKGRTLLAEARQNLQELRVKFDELEARRDALKEEFAAIERQLSAQLQEQGELAIRPDDFVKLNGQLQKAKLALGEVAKSKTRQDGMRAELTKELKKLTDLWHREFRQTEVAVKVLTDGQTALAIKLEYKGDKKAFLEQLKANVRGSRLREATLENIVGDYADFGAIYENLDVIAADAGDAFRKYFLAEKSSLLTWQVPNKVTFFYHGKLLGEHSLGQKASALMLFILNQGDNDLIVIDQPEDDLDNQTIFQDVVKLVRELKKETQFIFATHNANFPVLGDAEQVGSLSFKDKQVELTTGSVDQPEIQEAIVSIMEGGSEAFEKRKEIYHLWKQ